MDDFINVIKKDPTVRIKINDMLVRYNRFLYNNQLKIGYNSLIQNVILNELINIWYYNIRYSFRISMKSSRND